MLSRAQVEAILSEPRQMQPAGTDLHSIERLTLHNLCDTALSAMADRDRLREALALLYYDGGKPVG